MRNVAKTHLAIALLAAATTAAVTGFLPSGDASADHRTDRSSAAQLRAENQQLRTELSYYQSAYDEMADGLERIDDAADLIRERKTRVRIQRLVETTRERAARYVDELERDGWGRDDVTTRDHRDDYGYYAMTDSELKNVVARVQAESYADEQLALIKSVAASSYVTADQVVTLMKLCSYDDTRIEIAAALHPRVVDSQNWYQVYDGLTYASSKKTLRSRIGE
jgi:hypothetical protein